MRDLSLSLFSLSRTRRTPFLLLSGTERCFSICYYRIAQRDANRHKWQEKKAVERGERTTEIQERQKALREKERATMDAFMKMAKERFG